MPKYGVSSPAKFIKADNTCEKCGTICSFVADCIGKDKWFYCKKCKCFRLKKGD